MNFWQYSDDCLIGSTKGGSSTCGEQRGVVYINVIKVSLIPRRELNYVVETEKGERPSEEFVEIPRCWCVRNAVNESKKAVNCCVRVDGGI